MLSLERAKKLLNDFSLSDEEVREIRDSFYQLAEIIFEKWQEDKKTGKLNNPSSSLPNKTKSINDPWDGKNDKNRSLYLKNKASYCNRDNAS